MGARVLVVDDEPALRFVLRRCFDLAGYDVIEAGDGAAALRSVLLAPPDLVVTDLRMPVLDGFELTRRLRADPATVAVPIVVVSSDWQLASGADAGLAKPLEAGELLAMARDLMSQTGE